MNRKYYKLGFPRTTAKKYGEPPLDRGDERCEKVAYRSFDAAKKALKRIWKYPNKCRKPHRAYQCPYCRAYHLTSHDA